MQNNKFWFGFVALLVVIVIIVLSQKSGGKSVVSNQENNPSSAGSVATTSEKDQPQGPKPSLSSSFSADEKAAISASMGDSEISAEEQMVLATKVAKEVSSIEVGNCALNPAVLKVKYTNSFKLKNSGQVEASVLFYADNVLHVVPANGETTVKADFGKTGGGLFGYYCRVGEKTYPGLVLVYSL